MQAAFDEFRGPELAPGSEVVIAVAVLFMMTSPSMNSIDSHHHLPCKVESDADLDAFVRAKSDSAYHPSCTCKMGDDDMAVVDNAGKVCDDDNTIMSRSTLMIKAN